ncbi:hypothetical protein BaRGS_00020689, partial [Batillaria attramentaria]
MLAPVAGRNVEFVENAGLRLTNLAPEDAGVYSVHVNVNRHGSIPTESQNVTLLVSDPPVAVDGRLHAQLLPNAVYEESSHRRSATRSATVHVDGLEVRLLLLEAGQQALREDNLMLTQKVLNLTGEVTGLRNENAHLTQQNTDLTTQVHNLTEWRNILASCLTLSKLNAASGVYTVHIGTSDVPVYCDQDTDSGGWTEYEDGFGDVHGEYWL